MLCYRHQLDPYAMKEILEKHTLFGLQGRFDFEAQRRIKDSNSSISHVHVPMYDSMYHSGQPFMPKSGSQVGRYKKYRRH